MRKCIDSLLVGGEDVEILIINDGSTDKTKQIAEDYQRRFPSICRAINKPNGGHGSAVNTGIENATGLFFKVVDSDDWVQESAYMEILDKLRELSGGETTLDMLVSNFVYEKQGAKHKKVMSFRHALPQDRLFTWKEVHRFRKGQYILMHAVIYRTKLLRNCGLKLPEHTFYVDNLYVFEPLPYVKTMYYLDVNFYRYFIGREDQSVNEKVMIGRVDQQIKVNEMMVDYYLDHLSLISKKGRVKQYMFNYLEIVSIVTSIMLIRSGTPENLEKKQQFWNYVKMSNKWLFIKLRYGILGGYINLPGKGGRKVSIEGYKLAQKFFKFN